MRRKVSKANEKVRKMRLICSVLVVMIVIVGLIGISGCVEEQELNKSISDVQAPLQNQTTAKATTVKSAAKVDVTAKYLGTYVSDNSYWQPKT